MKQAGAQTSARTLVRGLGPAAMTAMVVTGVIGAGVFLKARAMTCNVGTPSAVLLAYAVAGLLTLAGALSLAELSAMMPRAGGQYNFIGAAFGRRWAFLYGWMETVVDGSASIAAVAMVAVIFFNDYLGGALGTSQVQLATVGTIILVSLITLASVHANGAFSLVLTVLKVLFIAGIGFVGYFGAGGQLGHFAHSGAAGLCQGIPAGARGGASGFGAAVLAALWSFNGWQPICAMAEEVRNPGRTMPRALFHGILILIAIYLFVTASYYVALEPVEVASLHESSSVAGAVMSKILGAHGAAWVSLGLVGSIFGCLHVLTLSAARIPFAMARDGLMPRALASLSPRACVPWVAVMLLAGLSMGFAFSGTFDVLTDMIVFVLLLFNGLSVAAVYVLRRRLPDAARPYRVWGYPVVPALFLLAAAYLMVNTLIAMPGRAVAGLALVALGLPVYAYYSRSAGAPHVSRDTMSDTP